MSCAHRHTRRQILIYHETFIADANISFRIRAYVMMYWWIDLENFGRGWHHAENAIIRTRVCYWQCCQATRANHWIRFSSLFSSSGIIAVNHCCGFLFEAAIAYCNFPLWLSRWMRIVNQYQCIHSKYFIKRTLRTLIDKSTESWKKQNPTQIATMLAYNCTPLSRSFGRHTRWQARRNRRIYSIQMFAWNVNSKYWLSFCRWDLLNLNEFNNFNINIYSVNNRCVNENPICQNAEHDEHRPSNSMCVFVYTRKWRDSHKLPFTIENIEALVKFQFLFCTQSDEKVLCVGLPTCINNNAYV